MAELGADHCFLDATPLGRDVLAGHFPTFASYCQAAGLDPEHDWVPVSPTAHYTMGGVLTDYDGRTTLEGLMAVGEVSCSGLHGANRLASNSLLEGAVIGGRAVEVLLGSKGPVGPREAVDLDETLPAQGERPAPERPAPERAPARRSALRSAMQSRAGVARDAAGLEELASLLARDFPLLRPPVGPAAPEDWELANMALIARAVVGLAARRQESRGAHWRTDYPADDPKWRLRQVVSLLPGGSLRVGHVDVEAGSSPLPAASVPRAAASLAAAAAV
jgi:aspartate oxidase